MYVCMYLTQCKTFFVKKNYPYIHFVKVVSEEIELNL